MMIVGIIDLPMAVWDLFCELFEYKKADDKIFVSKFCKKIMLSPSYIHVMLRIQRLEGKQCRSR